MADDKIAEVYRRIDREKQFIAKARTMRQATDNPAVQSRADNEIRDSQKNLMYLEEKMRELQLLQQGGGTDDGSYVWIGNVEGLADEVFCRLRTV